MKKKRMTMTENLRSEPEEETEESKMLRVLEETINFRLSYLIENEPEEKEAQYEVYSLFNYFATQLHIARIAQVASKTLNALLSVR